MCHRRKGERFRPREPLVPVRRGFVRLRSGNARDRTTPVAGARSRGGNAVDSAKSDDDVVLWSRVCPRPNPWPSSGWFLPCPWLCLGVCLLRPRMHRGAWSASTRRPRFRELGRARPLRRRLRRIQQWSARSWGASTARSGRTSTTLPAAAKARRFPPRTSCCLLRSPMRAKRATGPAASADPLRSRDKEEEAGGQSPPAPIKEKNGACGECRSS